MLERYTLSHMRSKVYHKITQSEKRFSDTLTIEAKLQTLGQFCSCNKVNSRAFFAECLAIAWITAERQKR